MTHTNPFRTTKTIEEIVENIEDKVVEVSLWEDVDLQIKKARDRVHCKCSCL